METHLTLVPSATAQPGCRDQTAQLTQRIFLYADELYRVPASYRQVRTSQGIAHISQAGRDFIVPTGECVMLARGADMALVSPLHGESLVLELFV